MIDRFNNPATPPSSLNANPPSEWDRQYEFRQGGNFKGIEQQLDYIASLGAGAIWISPVLKNPKPNEKYNYHGYAAQDFLSLDERFASDGTLATAEKEFTALVEAAHARGLYVIVDIVINHSARVFDYLLNGISEIDFTDANIMNGPLGSEPSIQWLDGSGQRRSDWIDTLPPSSQLSPDDAVWPADLQEHKDFFRRRGSKLSDTVGPEGFVKGDFGALRQLVAEYLSTSTTPQSIREQYGRFPVLNILIEAYVYLIARFDIDGFRMDTVKYVNPLMVEIFGNAIREFALSIGKRNFFTFGEIYDDEQTINNFVGRNTSSTEGFGIDAALDFPLFYKLPGVAKSNIDVDELRKVFKSRKETEKNLLSSHGEAGKYFVSFLDNHDQKERFNHPLTPKEQVLVGLAVLFCLQGIPALYYGTEQGLNGTKDQAGNIRVGDNLEAVREALWGKTPVAFDQQNSFYQNIQQFGILRSNEPALKYGRLYFREVSGNGKDFDFSAGLGGVVAFSRVLFDREIVIIANTNNSNPFTGFGVMDLDINRAKPDVKVAYSNMGTVQEGTVQITNATFYRDTITTAEAAILSVKLAPREVQILTQK